MHDGPNREIVNDNAKLMIHRLLARELGRDHRLLERARLSHQRQLERFPDHSFVGDWLELLGRPISEVRVLLTSRSREMSRLRLSSPFVAADGVDFTDQELRLRIWRAARRLAVRAGGARYCQSQAP
jgi:hypothetical protein